MKVLVCNSGGGSNFESLVQKSKAYKSYEVQKLVANRELGAIKVENILNMKSIS